MDHNISFQERAKLAKELLAKQGPVTLDYARAQVLWLKFRSNSNKNKEQDIKHHLEMYYPSWTKEQIDSEYIRLQVFSHLSVQEAAIVFKNGRE